MRKTLRVGAIGLALGLVAGLPLRGFAEGTKPFRSARLTYIEGQVRVEQAASAANSTAVRNMPLVEGTVISTGEDGQAEIEFEDGSLIRLTPNSGASLLSLKVDAAGSYQTRVALLGGLAYFELRADNKYLYTVDTGGDTLVPVENATFRINFDEPPAIFAVLDGSVHLSAASGSAIDAVAGQTVRADAISEGGQYMMKQAIAPESWDQWNEDRDEAAAAEAGSQTEVRSKYAGDQGYGWSDLDANGSWYDVPGQGEVWQPGEASLAAAGEDAIDDASAGPGFDPYGYGSWAYTPAGYVWASGYGWGWLPYRCGTWNFWDGFGWGWTPGMSCGAYGFGGGFGIVIGHAPSGFKRPIRPVTKPGPVHPILRGRGNHPPVAPVHPFTGPKVTEARTIAGNTVMPLPPIGGGYTPRGGSAIGWGLRRDYPIDRGTHAPVEGVIATHSLPAPNSGARAVWQTADQATGQATGQTAGQANAPVYRQRQHPVYAQQPGYQVPIERNGAAGRVPAPVERTAPAPRQPAPAQPRPAPAPRAEPAPASHPAAATPSHSK